MQPVQTRLTKLLGISSPIVVPPMAGASGGELAGQVALGGGYGFVAAGYGDTASFTRELEEVENLLALPKDASLPIGTGYLAWLLDKGGNAVEPLRIGLEKRVQSIWLSFGPNLGEWVEYIRQYDRERPNEEHKTLIWILVNSLEEALKATNDWKADVLVVQGSEAGGHGHSQALPLISLLALIQDAIPDGPPLIAAGGIVNGAQVAGLLAMGADGAAMGTRFLATPESTYSKNQKKAVVEATNTVRTTVYDTIRGTTGWPDGIDGRAVPNKTLDEDTAGIDIEERKRRYEEGLKNDDASRRVVWSGSSVGLVKEVKGAKTKRGEKVLVEEIHQDLVNGLRNLEKTKLGNSKLGACGQCRDVKLERRDRDTFAPSPSSTTIMPRGIPNAKKDEVPLKFTLFNIPPQMNQKQGGSNYLKTEEQTLWGRSKAARMKETAPTEGRRGSNVIVIHPGSKFLRIGKASDVFPIAVPSVIARRQRTSVPEPVHVSAMARRKPKDTNNSNSNSESAMDIDSPGEDSFDPVDPKISPIATALKERMVFYKLHIVSRAMETCVSFNTQVQPEIIRDHNDPYGVAWIDGTPGSELYFGEKALRMAEPHTLGYSVCWPFHGGRFNYKDYRQVGPQALLRDIELMWIHVLREMLKIKPESFKDFSVVLLVPDLFERSYVRELVNLLLVQMGFKQVCVQQESLSATFGAGISNACVVDVGAAKTSIAIVDEGLVLPETRMCLNVGGDDITEYLFALLQHIQFPYREAVLSHAYDWKLLEDLKCKICTLNEADVAMNIYDFVIRRPRKPTQKFTFRAYSEIVLAPMCLFEPRVIEFDSKLIYTRSLWDRDVGDEIVEQANDQITQAMIISTSHLIPSPMPPAPPQVPMITPTFSVMDSALDGDYSRPVFSVAPQTAQADPAEGPQVGTFAGQSQPPKFISLDASHFDLNNNNNNNDANGSATGNVTPEASNHAPSIHNEEEANPPDHQQQQPVVSRETQQDDVNAAAASSLITPTGVYPGGFNIDVAFEAGKLPLDVAIFNCARAANGGDDKICKYLQAVLVVGGTALVNGTAHALESRLQAIASPLIQNMEKVQIIPPPRDVDPRVLCWKGGAVLGKMDAVADLWVSRIEWDALGMRALKERSFFL